MQVALAGIRPRRHLPGPCPVTGDTIGLVVVRALASLYGLESQSRKGHHGEHQCDLRRHEVGVRPAHHRAKEPYEDKLNELQRLIGDLDRQRLRQADAASGAFHESYSQFTTGATQTIGGLQGLSDSLNAAADALGDTDTQLASAIRS